MNSDPQTAATNFAFSSVLILLLWLGDDEWNDFLQIPCFSFLSSLRFLFSLREVVVDYSNIVGTITIYTSLNYYVLPVCITCKNSLVSRVLLVECEDR